jgi:hypothetical protein
MKNSFLYVLLIGVATSSIIVGTVYASFGLASAEETTILPPLKQLMNGTSFHQISCSNGFELISKLSDGSPACVTHQTAVKLIERNWGYLRPANDIRICHIYDTTISDLRHDYVVNEPIDFSVRIVAYCNLCQDINTFVEDTANNKLWTEPAKINIAGSGPDYDTFTYDTKKYGDTFSINKTGSYFLVVSFGNDIMKNGFSVRMPIQNDNTTTLSNKTNQTYYPVYQAQLVGIINASSLPPITDIPPSPAVSATPLPQITESTTINYSNPALVKIISVGMSPNPLKVGDIPSFTVTYQDISDKPIYGVAGCGGSPNLQYVVTPMDKVENVYYSSCQQANFEDIVQPNEIITEVPDSVYVYKIIQSGLLHVTLTLDLSDNSTYRSHNIDIIQFNVNAMQ